MARRRQSIPAPVADGTVPEPLRDHRHPLWDDAAAVDDLAAEHRLTLTLPPVGRDQWWGRFDAFRHAWMDAHGLLVGQWPRPDYDRCKTLGIDMEPTSRHRLRDPYDRARMVAQWAAEEPRTLPC